MAEETPKLLYSKTDQECLIKKDRALKERAA